MNDDALNTIENYVGRIGDFAVAALDRSENNPAMQTLLTEIQEKAAAIHDLIQEAGR